MSTYNAKLFYLQMRDFSDDECEKASKHKKTGGKRERGKER